jgi:biopolymer transport protein ExbB/biopolymer transport protein TolQ
MGAVAIAVVVILLIMSVYSIAIMVERYLSYSAAKKQSLEFAARVTETLRNDRLEEAIKISEDQKAPLAMVVGSGLQEFHVHEQSSPIAGDEIDASKQALQRAVASKTAEFKRGLSVLALVGSIAPFIGLFGTVFGIINAFRAIRNSEEAPGIAEVAGGISQALFTTALGLLVAVAAVWLFNYLTEKTEELMGEVDKSAVEIIEPFIKSHTNAMRL